jgi:hypothetical protein
MNTYCIIETTVLGNGESPVCLGVIHHEDTATRIIGMLARGNDLDRKASPATTPLRIYEAVPMATNEQQYMLLGTNDGTVARIESEKQ